MAAAARSGARKARVFQPSALALTVSRSRRTALSAASNCCSVHRTHGHPDGIEIGIGQRGREGGGKKSQETSPKLFPIPKATPQRRPQRTSCGTRPPPRLKCRRATGTPQCGHPSEPTVELPHLRVATHAAGLRVRLRAGGRRLPGVHEAPVERKQVHVTPQRAI